MTRNSEKKRSTNRSAQSINAPNAGLAGSFSFDTIEDFDKHIDLSILGYLNLQKTILNMSAYFIKSNSNVYDIGCSTGLMVKYMNAKIADSTVRYFGVDQEPNLLGRSCEAQANIYFEKENICSHDFLMKRSSLVISMFTLQFLPVHQRSDVLQKIFSSLQEGGGFIVSEKNYVSDGQIQEIFTFTYYDYKLETFSPSEILSKQKDLRKIMNPVSEQDFERSLKEVGFKKVFKFWQSLQFNAWLCIK